MIEHYVAGEPKDYIYYPGAKLLEPIELLESYLAASIEIKRLDDKDYYPKDKQIYFQPSGSEIATTINELHDYFQYYLIIMIAFITWILFYIIYKFPATKMFNSLIVKPNHKGLHYVDMDHGSWIEIVWTTVPAIILVTMAIPSFLALYQTDNTTEFNLTIKAIGSQWYWTYEISDLFNNLYQFRSFDSYMIATDSLKPGQLRLMEVDNPLIVPVNKDIALYTTSRDVIHSWSIPSLGVKADAIPGRLNKLVINVTKLGSYYGACQEICGIQHAFMPINLIAIDVNDYALLYSNFPDPNNLEYPNELTY